MTNIDLWILLKRLGFLVEGLALIFISKFLRDLFLLLRGYRLYELLKGEKNLAMTIDLCGFLLAMVMATLHSIIIYHHTWLGQASEVAMTGLVVLLLLLVADWITDKLIFPNIDDHQELIEKNNVSLAICRFGSVTATGLIISSSLGDSETRLTLIDQLSHCVSWFLVGQLMLITIHYLYQKITPYDDLQEIKEQNKAAALPIACILIAIGTTINAGLRGQSENFLQDLLSVSLYLGICTILLYVLRTISDKLLIPNSSLNEAISKEKSLSAGLIEGTSFLMGSLMLSYFLT